MSRRVCVVNDGLEGGREANKNILRLKELTLEEDSDEGRTPEAKTPV